jgi:hypothetical protein
MCTGLKSSLPTWDSATFLVREIHSSFIFENRFRHRLRRKAPRQSARPLESVGSAAVKEFAFT